MDYNLINQKLDELNLDGYKHILKNNWQIPQELIDWLKSKNFELLGDGNFSEVWISDDCNFIVKTGSKKLIDKNFENFVNYCHKVNDIHLPKFGNFKKIGDDSFVIFMEKLYPSDFNRNLSWFLRTYSEFVNKNQSTSFQESLNLFFNEKEVNTLNLMKYIEDWLEDEKNVSIRRMRIHGSNQIESLTKTVFNTTIGMHKDLNDIGPGNIMERNDGTLVLNDPIYGSM